MTYSKEARTALFWGVCIPLRTYLATRGDRADLRAFALVIGTRWVAGLEDSHVGQFGGPAWWKEERALHGMLWLGYAATGDSRWLKADVGVGVVNWIYSNTSVGQTCT